MLKLQAPHCVRFAGCLPRSQVTAACQASKAMPYAYVEAIHCWCCLLTTNTSSQLPWPTTIKRMDPILVLLVAAFMATNHSTSPTARAIPVPYPCPSAQRPPRHLKPPSSNPSFICSTSSCASAAFKADAQCLAAKEILSGAMHTSQSLTWLNWLIVDNHIVIRLTNYLIN